MMNVEVGYGQRVVDTVNFRPGSLAGNVGFPAGMVYDRGLNRLFLSGGSCNSLSIVECATGVVDNLPCGEFFSDLAINETTHRVYILNRLPQYTSIVDTQVVVVDGVNKKVLATISIGGDIGHLAGQRFSRQLAVNEATNTIYVTDYLEDRLVVIDGISHAVSEIPVGPSPVQIAVNEKTNKIFVVDEEEDVLYFIDGTSQTMLARLNLPYRGVGYSRLMVNERLNRVYMVQRDNNVLISIDAAGYSIYRIITLTAGPTGEIAINETSGKIYLPLWDATIDVVRDRKSNVTNIATSITDSAVNGIAIDESRNLIYATQYLWPM
ncbi:MAG: YncE family protein, partial [Candidatus Aminicenantes bacterium]|nr:YncE family protein [Candidatus Aminicenantes bacterium]